MGMLYTCTIHVKSTMLIRANFQPTWFVQERLVCKTVHFMMDENYLFTMPVLRLSRLSGTFSLKIGIVKEAFSSIIIRTLLLCQVKKPLIGSFMYICISYYKICCLQQILKLFYIPI